MIPMHPESVRENPAVLRWVVPAGTFAFSGPVTSAPGDLGALLTDGILASLTTDASGVLTELGPGNTWRMLGGAVRAALASALRQPEAWNYGGDSGSVGDGTERRGSRGNAGDDVLREVATSVVAGAVGDFVRSHGGRIDLVSVTDGVVAVRLRGSCTGCPAAGLTLHSRLERELRSQFPGLGGVVAV